jgi:phosphate starvation-inducible protein PhoH
MSLKPRRNRKANPVDIQEEGFKTPNTGLKLKVIKPKTDNQAKAFAQYEEGKNLLLGGAAGSGKSFVSLYLALKTVMDGTTGKNEVHIIRSVVPTRDMGFLPGNAKEKSKVYEAPYYSICQELFGRGDAYDLLKNKKIVNFLTTSFIRGITLNNCVIVVDECQSMDFHELDTIITRIGENCTIILCGDVKQNDLRFNNRDVSGLEKMKRILESMKEFSIIKFTTKDIVRSGIVRSYLLSKDKLENDNYPIRHKNVARLELIAAE